MHKIYQFNNFELYNLVVLGTSQCCVAVTTTCFQNIFIAQKGNLVPSKQLLPIPQSHQLLATTDKLSISMDLLTLNISYKLNHTIYGLLCLASFT